MSWSKVEVSTYGHNQVPPPLRTERNPYAFNVPGECLIRRRAARAPANFRSLAAT